ncbi:hypothetical protein TRFO_15518 [Tritrichomonas foetus]|uniref:Importin N-terminal domain-containing protein n=1 Tax=Tritrichomonas foetus TaxID=1144522 RepID=A0A1J4KSE5_9EUKA|nr:hypothetical protein TRFO_15518 [Tritrichomonas foetus]|eukprot:OHT14217.1 hypothetical protein TRFO_15518 [Tritrichomonas foetus]
MEELVQQITCFLSNETNEEVRRSAELFIMNSKSPEFLFKLFEVLQSSNTFHESIRVFIIILIGKILNEIDSFEQFPNILKLIGLIYEFSFIMMQNSDSKILVHHFAHLHVHCIDILTSNSESPNIFCHNITQGIMKSENFCQTYAFCLSMSLYCEDHTLDMNESLELLSSVLAHLQKDSNLQIVNEILNLCRVLFINSEEIINVLKNDSNLTVSLINSIFMFLQLHETFSNAIKCFEKLICCFPESIFSIFDQIIHIILMILNDNSPQENREIVLSGCDFIDEVVYNIEKFPNLNPDVFINVLLKIMSNVPPCCDLPNTWDPHNAAQLILKMVISILPNHSMIDNYIRPFLVSDAYGEKSTSLLVYEMLISHFGEVYFLPIKQTVLNLLHDSIPRVRESSILCLKSCILTIPKKGCNDAQFQLIQEIYESVKVHINEPEIPEISLVVFHLFYHLSLISGFDCGELMNLIFFNFIHLQNVFQDKHIMMILTIIKNAHFCIKHSFPALEHLILICLNNQIHHFSLPSVFSIAFAFIDRFGPNLEINSHFIEQIISFSYQPNEYSSFTLPLIGVIFNKIIPHDFNLIAQPICQKCMKMLELNDAKLLAHSLQFFKQLLLNGNLLPLDFLNFLFPLFINILVKLESDEDNDVKIFSLYNAFLIIQQKPSLPLDYCINFYLQFLSYSIIFQFGKFTSIQIFQNIIDIMRIIIGIIPPEILVENPILVSKFTKFCLKLPKLSLREINKIIKIFDYFASNSPQAFKEAVMKSSKVTNTFINVIKENNYVMNFFWRLFTKIQLISIETNAS